MELPTMFLVTGSIGAVLVFGCWLDSRRHLETAIARPWEGNQRKE